VWKSKESLAGQGFLLEQTTVRKTSCVGSLTAI
jgi:hypothetical protein